MSNIRVELNHDGIRAFLRSAETGKLVSSYAERAAERLGEGYKSDEKLMSTRAIASVYTDTDEARRANLQDNSLLKAVLQK